MVQNYSKTIGHILKLDRTLALKGGLRMRGRNNLLSLVLQPLAGGSRYTDQFQKEPKKLYTLSQNTRWGW